MGERERSPAGSNTALPSSDPQPPLTIAYVTVEKTTVARRRLLPLSVAHQRLRSRPSSPTTGAHRVTPSAAAAALTQNQTADPSNRRSKQRAFLGRKAFEAVYNQPAQLMQWRNFSAYTGQPESVEEEADTFEDGGNGQFDEANPKKPKMGCGSTQPREGLATDDVNM
nr:hypothetical protein Iba_chr06dCG5620 [Ipomoea batatas]